jgi:hypothetical protein
MTKKFSQRDSSTLELLPSQNLTAGEATYTKAFNVSKASTSSLQLIFYDSLETGVFLEGSNHPNATASGTEQVAESFSEGFGQGEPEYWFTYDLTPAVSGTSGDIVKGSVMYDISGVGSTWVRLRIQPVTSGTCEVYGTMKNEIY